MEITLRIPSHRIVLSIGMERIQTSRKEAELAEEVKGQHILAAIEKEREYAINQSGLYLMQIERNIETAAY